MKKQILLIESEDIYNKWMKVWVTIHSLYLDDEFIDKSSNAIDMIEESGIDLSDVIVDDGHTQDVLNDVYRGEWMIQRYAE